MTIQTSSSSDPASDTASDKALDASRQTPTEQMASEAPNSEKNSATPETPGDDNAQLGTGAILQSVFAAALGVQSSKNRERDFNQGNFKVYVAAGIIFTALFIGGVFSVVQLVLASR